MVERIRPSFDEYVSTYDELKYPPKIYEDLVSAFEKPDNVTGDDIRKAMLWKFGHPRKQRIPSHHERLISCIQEGWPDLLLAIPDSTSEFFQRARHRLRRAEPVHHS